MAALYAKIPLFSRGLLAAVALVSYSGRIRARRGSPPRWSSPTPPTRRPARAKKKKNRPEKISGRKGGAEEEEEEEEGEIKL